MIKFLVTDKNSQSKIHPEKANTVSSSYHVAFKQVVVAQEPAVFILSVDATEYAYYEVGKEYALNLATTPLEALTKALEAVPTVPMPSGTPVCTCGKGTFGICPVHPFGTVHPYYADHYGAGGTAWPNGVKFTLTPDVPNYTTGTVNAGIDGKGERPYFANTEDLADLKANYSGDKRDGRLWTDTGPERQSASA